MDTNIDITQGKTLESPLQIQLAFQVSICSILDEKEKDNGRIEFVLF